MQAGSRPPPWPFATPLTPAITGQFNKTSTIVFLPLQLGFLAALGCEVFTGKPVLAQLAGNGSTILTWMLLVTAGTAVPILRVRG